ncbi:MAG TPA: phosphoribosyltransferase family protein [Gaiellales bacterium]|nr:phosphoribosyltransferase family protein [Gaiellales bacterium]
MSAGPRDVPFADRRDAGGKLADRLSTERLSDGVVVGLARGGVVVAAEVARSLGLALDALAVRKVGHPLQPELAIGAVAPGGVYVRDQLDLVPADVSRAVALTEDEARALDRRLHELRPAVDVSGRPCILVDDGLATGATMIAAARWARRAGAARVIVAVPVGSPQAVETLRAEADDVICLAAPALLFAVGEWYVDFDQVPDEEVDRILAGAVSVAEREAEIDSGTATVDGDLSVPAAARGIVVFAHGSGSSRRSPRNRLVAGRLHGAGLATLLFDLLTPAEAADRAHVFDIPLLAERLAGATAWVGRAPEAAGLPVGYFGASTGGAAALWAAADAPEIAAIVSRGGRPDLAAGRLERVRAPTLLVVGGEDTQVLALNREARAAMRCESELVVVPGASHLFEEPGALEQVADHAAAWFARHLRPATPGAP